MTDPGQSFVPGSSFVYVTYIRTTPAKLWQALTEPAFLRQFWFGFSQDCSWLPGASWKMLQPDGTVCDAGEVLEVEPQKRLVLKWRHEFRPNLKEEGDARMSYTLEPKDDMVKLTITHEIARSGSKLIEAVSGGWPLILASLKSFLETGTPIARSFHSPKPG